MVKVPHLFANFTPKTPTAFSMVNSPSSSKSGCLKPLLIGVIGATLISGLTIFFVFTRGLYHPPELPEAPLVIENAVIFDGDSVLPGQPRVVIEGETIRCIGADCETPEGAQVIDAQGQSLLPGLIDGYLRFYAPSSENLSQNDLSGFFSFVKQRPEVRRNLIRAGVTTLFSAGDLPQNILLLKDQQQTWDLAGPRIRCAGPDFTAPEGYPLDPLYRGNESLEEDGVRTSNDPATAQQEAAELLGYGMDAIKVVYSDEAGQVPKLDREVLRGLIEVAEKKGAYAVVHCGDRGDLRTAAELGAKVLAYGPAELLDSVTIALMREKDVVYYPLLASRPRAERPRLRDNVQALLEAGVRVGLGSEPRGEDAVFGRSLHDELIAQVEADRDPLEALQAATRGAARTLRIDDRLGHLAQGLQADLILVEGRPWEAVEDIRQVQTVIQGGRIMLRDRKIQE